MKKKYKNIDSALCIFLMTIFSYSTAYLIEWTDALYYNYDFKFIEIGINQLIYNNASVILTYLSILIVIVFLSIIDKINQIDNNFQPKIFIKINKIRIKIIKIKNIQYIHDFLIKKSTRNAILIICLLLFFYFTISRIYRIYPFINITEFIAITLCCFNGYLLFKLIFRNSYKITSIFILCIIVTILILISFGIYRVKQLESPLFEKFSYKNNEYMLIKLYDKNIIGRKIEKIENKVNQFYWTDDKNILYIPKEKLEDYSFTLVNVFKKTDNNNSLNDKKEQAQNENKTQVKNENINLKK